MAFVRSQTQDKSHSVPLAPPALLTLCPVPEISPSQGWASTS